MRSLRARIFLLLAAATVLVWSAAAVWIYVSTRAQVEEVLDRRLVEAARMVGSLAGSAGTPLQGGAAASAVPRTGAYSRQLSCQIWSLDGRLLGRSRGAPREPLTPQVSGFSEHVIDGAEWRVYSHADPELGIRVLVGDNLSVRRHLVADLITGLLLPGIAGLLALALLIWTAVGRGLAPLREVARELGARDPSDFRPLRVAATSQELESVTRSIDALFTRLERVRASERHFVASAAHELQTPLAGLRTHAQIALMADDAATRQNSLRQIETSVERTSRLVQQLLELAREESGAEAEPEAWLALAAVVDRVREELAGPLRNRDLRLEPDPAVRGTEILMNEQAATVVLRNLVENACNHAPPGSAIRIGAEASGAALAIHVDDLGPGIAEADLERVKQRFVRGPREKGPGSGLGLSIVEVVLDRIGARLDLANRPEGGLRASIVLPAPRSRPAAAPEP